MTLMSKAGSCPRTLLDLQKQVLAMELSCASYHQEHEKRRVPFSDQSTLLYTDPLSTPLSEHHCLTLTELFFHPMVIKTLSCPDSPCSLSLCPFNHGPEDDHAPLVAQLASLIKQYSPGQTVQVNTLPQQKQEASELHSSIEVTRVPQGLTQPSAFKRNPLYPATSSKPQSSNKIVMTDIPLQEEEEEFQQLQQSIDKKYLNDSLEHIFDQPTINMVSSGPLNFRKLPQRKSQVIPQQSNFIEIESLSNKQKHVFLPMDQSIQYFNQNMPPNSMLASDPMYNQSP